MSVEFVNWNALNDEDKEAYSRVSTIIKDKKVIQNVANNNMLKPSQVAKLVREHLGIDFRTHHNTLLWKAFKIRPLSTSQDKFETLDAYCVYDEAHNDYLYTKLWVDVIIRLFTEHEFTLENIALKCTSYYNIEDYEKND